MSGPLVVAATEIEAAHVPAGLPVAIVGIGKVPSADATTLAVAQHRPSVVVNVGTAGSLVGHVGLFVPSRVLNHDLSAAALRALGIDPQDELEIADGDGSVLATGDTFVTDPVVRDALAQRAGLVDMEGYAVAFVAARMGVPCRLVEHVSDQADDSALDWLDAVDASARVLGQWLADHL